MERMSAPIIEVKNLVKNYGSFKAVRNISFNVYEGNVYGFLGPNGAGKSTTIRILLSLIRATEGEVKLFGKDIRTHRDEILRRIGCIVEKPDFYKYLSAEKNIALCARISGAAVSKKQIHEMLDFVGLKGREKDKVSGFSHGMKQRLGFAQTLIHDPELIILDEPTTGLDPQGIIDIRNLILKLKTEKNKTILLSSHILSEIELIADRMVIINKGEAIVEGNVRELLNAQEVIVVFTVDHLPKAQSVLEASGFAGYLAQDHELHFQTSLAQSAEINKVLCANGIQVYSMETKRKLEDYFLKLINH
ncbi:MAG: ABC transporter ATP-binding protein [Sphingobacteriia bacterium]|nr:ABC transporter ATP-binding protein [Sphingobacteriia bacterium]